jgi:hypothetical protein
MKVYKKVQDVFDAVQWRPGKEVKGVEVEYYREETVTGSIIQRSVYFSGQQEVVIAHAKFAGHDCIRAFLITLVDGVKKRTRVYNGDWIITDSKGNRSVCRKADFDSTYRALTSFEGVNHSITEASKSMKEFSVAAESLPRRFRG